MLGCRDTQPVDTSRSAHKSRADAGCKRWERGRAREILSQESAWPHKLKPYE